ncbi:MAG: MFS transporter [Christensenella sp.]|nr:MFS transporter [Christensenella sp.]
MTEKTAQKKPFQLLLFLGLIFVAINLRAPITAVGPLVPTMKTELPFSSGIFGLLTTIPLIMFALLSPFVRRISDRLGAGKTLLIAVIAILLGVALRSYAGNTGLFDGTFLLGAGIAIGNVLVPGIIKARFPERLGLATGAFTISMTSFAAVSAAVSYPISKLPNMGWRNSLAIWIALAIVGILVWLPQRKLSIVQTKTDIAAAQQQEKSVWRTRLAWWLTALMGAQSFLFYFFAAWLPSIALFKGLSPEAAGYLAFAFQLTTIPAAFLIPAIATRLKDQRGLISVVSVLYIASLCGLALVKSSALLTVCVMLYGFSTGSCFNLCMLLIGLRTQNAERATSLSGMVQSLGYGFGALGPLLGGWLFDWTGNWNAALVCVGILIVIIFFSGRQAGKNQYI